MRIRRFKIGGKMDTTQFLWLSWFPAKNNTCINIVIQHSVQLSLLSNSHTQNSSFPGIICTWEITFPALPVVLQGVLPMDIESTSAVMDSRAVEWAIILSRPCIEPCLSSRLVWNPRPPPPVPVELLSPGDFKRIWFISYTTL